MSIIKISCVDAVNTLPLDIPGLDSSIVRSIDVTYHYGLARKPRPGRIWKLNKVGKISVFDQWATFDSIGIKDNDTAVMVEV